METANNRAKAFDISDVDWSELSDIGIIRDELESEGQLDKLLSGERTEIVSLRLCLLGVDVEMDATLQIVEKNEVPILEIIGIKPLDD